MSQNLFIKTWTRGGKGQETCFLLLNENLTTDAPTNLRAKFSSVAHYNGSFNCGFLTRLKFLLT